MISERMDWHALPVDEVVKRLQSHSGRGLSREEATRRLAQYGPNRLPEIQSRGVIAVFVEQFKSLIVGLLLVAVAISFVLGERLEGLAILSVVFLNAAIGFFTEWKAARALDALKKQAVPLAHVIRDDIQAQIPAEELVPGDVIVLAAGSRVPADGRVLEAVHLEAEEASLTGESRPIGKVTTPVLDSECPLADRNCMTYFGTTVVDGRGMVIVTATGTDTEVGRIGTLIGEVLTHETPLAAKLRQLGQFLLGIVLALCVIIVVAGWLRGNDFFLMLKVGISLAIAAIPEGLPAVTTLTLAVGMQRMARKGALVRRLLAVETLGSTTVICSDKTGTLTKNEMTVQAYWISGRQVEVTGVGYSLNGEFREQDHELDPRVDEHLALALRTGALCADATIVQKDGVTEMLGDPTEGALVVAAEKAGISLAALTTDYPRIGEIPFNSTTQRMVTVHRTPQGNTVAYVKGAPGVILESCGRQLTADGVQRFSTEDRNRVLQANKEFAAKALRVLALAYKELSTNYQESDLAEDLVFVGLVGMMDPLRDEVKPALNTCRQAGIRAVMITGDQEATAAEIGRQLGLDRDPQGQLLRTVHQRELNNLDPVGLQRVVNKAGIFARISPEHKLRIVEALQAVNHVVAMTGDGVNDAPALKQSNIGVAMGIKGTDVAKEVSDIIITDDNFATIVDAVEQGRIIYANITRFIHYLFSCNFSEILVVFLAVLWGWPLPLAPLQLLWLNIVTDVFPAMAIALEPSSPDAMRKPPRSSKQPLLDRGLVLLIGSQGTLLAVLTLAVFWIGIGWYGNSGEGLRHAVTLAFSTLATLQVLHAFNARSQRRSTFGNQLFSNPWIWAAVSICLLLQVAAVYQPLLQRVLHTVPLNWNDALLIAGSSLALVVVVEMTKLAARHRNPTDL